MLYYHTLDDHYLSGKNPKFIKMFFSQSKQMMHKKLTVFMHSTCVDNLDKINLWKKNNCKTLYQFKYMY